MELENKTCVVTGGTSGIGKSTVLRFVEEGANVVFNGRRKERGLKLIEEIKSMNYPGRANYFQCDVSVEEEVCELGKYVKKEFGNCEVLFNSSSTVEICKHLPSK